MLIVDVGYAFTSAGVYELPAEDVPTRLSLAHDSVGARDLDRTLWEHCAAELQAKHGTRVAPRTKPARRLMEEVVKCKKILSTIASCSLELECFGEEERDIRLGLTRAQFEEMAETHVERVAAVVRRAVAEAGECAPAEELRAVEGIGGATRIPCVVAAVCAAAGGGTETLGRMLDSASCIAQGAVFIAQADPADRPFAPAKEAPVVRLGCTEDARAALRTHASRAADDRMAAWVVREGEMRAADEAAAARGEAFNALEAYLLETKGAIASSSHGAKLEPARASLDAGEDWLYSDEAEVADTAALEARLTETRASVEAMCPEYFAAVAEEKAALEAELAKEAEAEAARVAVEGKDDHDMRKLKFPDRMKKVMLNKEEGTSMFKDGNLSAAVERWGRALTHCGKFVDMSPEQTAEVRAVELSLHLNTAMAHLKLGGEVSLKRCEEAATAALAIDASNAKALYRRAAAREKCGKFADARADLQAHPEQGDSAVAALAKRVEAQIARQKKKEAAMARKMFG